MELERAKPILFNTEMVCALLDDRKTVTRRVVKPQPPEGFIQAQDVSGEWFFNDKLGDNDMMAWWPSYEKGIAPPYRPGDILYVRETWWPQHSEDYPFVYKASVENPDAWKGEWHPSIHMPREAARIFLRVRDVQVEQLGDITGKQARAEGFANKGSFIREFLTIYPDCTAETWVWVIKFERISKEVVEKAP